MSDPTRTDPQADDAKEALLAIIARIEGVWDHPALLKFGPMLTTLDDVLQIARSVGLDESYDNTEEQDMLPGGSGL